MNTQETDLHRADREGIARKEAKARNYQGSPVYFPRKHGQTVFNRLIQEQNDIFKGVDYGDIEKRMLEALLKKEENIAMVEKICANKSRGCKKFLKKLTSRTLRRLGKKDPEDAPRRVRDITHGWSD